MEKCEVVTHIFVLLGTLVGGGITYFVQRAHIHASRDADRDALLRSKLEELYQVALDVREAYLYSWTQTLLRLKGNLEAEPFAKKVERHRLGMLVNLYFPTLVAPFQSVEDAGARYGEPLGRATMLSTIPSDGREKVASDLTETYQGLMAEIDAFLRAASDLSGFRKTR